MWILCKVRKAPRVNERERDRERNRKQTKQDFRERQSWYAKGKEE